MKTASWYLINIRRVWVVEERKNAIFLWRFVCRNILNNNYSLNIVYYNCLRLCATVYDCSPFLQLFTIVYDCLRLMTTVYNCWQLTIGNYYVGRYQTNSIPGRFVGKHYPLRLYQDSCDCVSAYIFPYLELSSICKLSAK